MDIIGMILPSLMPAMADGLKGLFQKFFGGTRPVAVDDQVKLMAAEVEKLKAMAELDRPSEGVSKWVADLRASFRYIGAGLIILGTLFFTLVFFWMSYAAPESDALRGVETVLNLFIEMSASVFAFMFGDRVYLSLRALRGSK